MLVTIMVDASWCHDTKVAGYGAWLASERRRTRFAGFIQQQVSQAMVAEAMAVVNSIVGSMNLGVAQPNDTILVRTDCQAAIMLFEGKRKPKDGDDALTLEVFNKVVAKYGVTMRFKHIKGHTNDQHRASVSNSVCDRVAKAQLKIARNLFKLNEIRQKIGLLP